MESLSYEPVVLIGGILLFVVVAIGMLLAPLLLGWLLRPSKPNAEKTAVYECGEPTIGASNVQFDLRFYVVALLFIVFDVEVAFFFPWAVVFGKAKTLSVSANALDDRLEGSPRLELSRALLSRPDAEAIEAPAARKFLYIALADMLVFFGVVLVGFAYVWKRGDLDWVRSTARQKALADTGPPIPAVPTDQPALARL